MSIRTYREGDEDEIAATLNECFESFKSFELTGDKWLKVFEFDPGYKKEFVFVAEKDGKIVSHVQLVERDLEVGAAATLRVAGIANVATLRDYRRSGISTRLLEHALDIARKKGFCASGLFTSTRIAAHRIYLKLGFTDVYSANLLFRDYKQALSWNGNDKQGRSSPQRVKVRESNEGDDACLLSIYERNYEKYGCLALRDDEKWKRKFRNLFVYECPFYEEESKPDNILVAEREGEIVGYAMSCIAQRDKFCHICEVVTLPGEEREAGRQLAEAILARMREAKPLTIMIYSAQNVLNDQLFRKGSTPFAGAGEFMFKSIDLTGTIDSVLRGGRASNRIVQSRNLRYLGAITVNLANEQRATLRPGEGVSVPEEKESRDEVTFADNEAFASMLFGGRSFTELVNDRRVRLSLSNSKSREVVGMFERLFPKKPMMTFPADFW